MKKADFTNSSRPLTVNAFLDSNVNKNWRVFLIVLWILKARVHNLNNKPITTLNSINFHYSYKACLKKEAAESYLTDEDRRSMILQNVGV
jgi:hypothetical protein